MRKSDLHVGWASHKAASHACHKWHYSKSVPVPPLVKVGAWEKGVFVGVVIFSRGASSSLLKPYGLRQDEGCELTRIAMRKHESHVTRIVRLAVSFLKKHNSGLRLVVSFADPRYGHHGGIYQGGNWIYAGTTAPDREFWKDGKRYHSRQVSEKGWRIQSGQVRKAVKPSECDIVNTCGKHRYLLPLDKEMRSSIQCLSQPYPKRAGSVDSGTPGLQPGWGGANPTPALLQSTVMAERDA